MVVVANRPHALRMLRLIGLDHIVPVIGDRHAAIDLLVQHV